MTDLSRATEIALEKWEGPAERRMLMDLSDYETTEQEDQR